MRNDNGYSTAHNMTQRDVTAASTDYGQNASNMTPRGAAAAYQSATPVPPLGWTPPAIIENYKARVVTQADVDHWLKIEVQYNSLVAAIRRELD